MSSLKLQRLVSDLAIIDLLLLELAWTALGLAEWLLFAAFTLSFSILLLKLLHESCQLILKTLILGESLQAFDDRLLLIDLLLGSLHGFGLQVEGWIVLDFLDSLGVLKGILGLHLVVN